MQRPLLLLAGLAITACADTQATPTRLAATHDTVGGVPRLLYAATGEPALDWSTDTLATIGDIMGDDPRYQFDDITPPGMSGDAAGNIWLLDASGHRVIGYDSTGTFISSHGREGSGPGEINRAFGMSVGPGDTLWVMEMLGRRLTGFPVAGGEARVVSFDVDIVPAPPLAVLDDHVIAEMLQFRPDDGPNQGERHYTLARFASDGSVQDTIFSSPMPEQNVVQIEAGNRRIMMLTTPEFSPSLEWAVFSDGTVAVVDDDRYAIHLLDADGTEHLRIERDAPPRAVTEADREAVRAGIRDQPRMRIGGGGDDAMAEEMVKQRLEAMTFAETIPRIERIAVDPQDRLWVLTSADEPDGEQRIDIFDRTGALLGSVHGMEMPTVFLQHGRAAYLARDEDTDVQQVTLVRLESPMPS